MSEVALTDIKHGLEDGSVVEVKQGDKIPSTIPASAVRILRDSGAVGEAPVTREDIDSKDARIAELEKALAEAQAKSGVADDNKTPAK